MPVEEPLETVITSLEIVPAKVAFPFELIVTFSAALELNTLKILELLAPKYPFTAPPTFNSKTAVAPPVLSKDKGVLDDVIEVDPVSAPPVSGNLAAIEVFIEFANLSAVTWSSAICLVCIAFVTIFVAVT